MKHKIVFPLTVYGLKFLNHKELYDFYYGTTLNSLTTASKPFWEKGINLTELVHFPERFTIVQNKEKQNRITES